MSPAFEVETKFNDTRHPAHFFPGATHNCRINEKANYITIIEAVSIPHSTHRLRAMGLMVLAVPKGTIESHRKVRFGSIPTRCQYELNSN